MRRRRLRGFRGGRRRNRRRGGSARAMRVGFRF